ncbi:MAG: hypothetical protein ACJ76Y_26945 [Thermoanaerobaculia bacterium]
MSLALLLAGLALGAGLGAAAVLAAGWRRRRPLPTVPLPPPAEPVYEPEDLRRMIDETPELQALYARIGFPPGVERECQRILADLAGMVRTEIPDFAALRAAVAEAERGLAASSSGAEARFLAEDVELLRAVGRAGEDREEVLRLLDRDPVRRLLPFVERIPMTRNGERIWRTPVELSLLRKRPADPDRCERLLDEIEKLARAARLPRAEPARAEVLEVVARARRDARRDGAYMPTSLRALEVAVESWLRAAPPEARRRRDELDALLVGLLRVRRGRPGGEDLREAARAQAQTYAATPWMQTPWLTSYALANLLDAELSGLPGEERRQPSPRAAALRWVRDEVASSHFDGEETIRRLRQQEERELYVHSLVYALLRMSRLPAAPAGD